MLGPVVDVAIGLVFTFLLFALLLSTLMEAAAGWFKLRAARLEQAFAQLIEHPEAVAEERNLVARWLSGLGTGRSRNVESPPDVATLTPEEVEAMTERASGDLGPTFELRHEDVYHHPLVGGGGGSRPSYVAAANFSSALLQALRAGASGEALGEIRASIDALPPGKLRDALVTALNEAGDDLNALKVGIERWYDNAMDRLSGQYKRYTQLITFLLGLALAILFNVNAIDVVKRLYAEPTLRAAMVDQAKATVNKATPEAAEPDPDAAVEMQRKLKAVNEASNLLLTTAPVGWSNPPASPAAFFAAAGDAVSHPVTSLFGFLTRLPGWLVTALAGMLAAPFWFDLLNKLINIRNAGPKPESTTDTMGKGK